LGIEDICYWTLTRFVVKRYSELCRKHSISDATFYKWRAKYAGLAVSDVKKLR
jgi:hypothetical protein